MEKTIAGLGKRVFLLHSVHEAAPITFETRWTMSYLAGPMTREQIKTLQAQTPTFASSSGANTSGPSDTAAIAAATGGGMSSLDATPASHAPVLPPDVPQFFVPPNGDSGALQYNPAILAVADVSFSSAKLGVTEQRRVTLLGSMDDGPITLEWDGAERVDLDVNALERSARDHASFGALPKAASNAKSYAAWAKAFQKWIVVNEQVELLRSPALKLTSTGGESERDFRIRLQNLAREERDGSVEKLRGKYATKLAALQERIRRAQDAVAREQSQASQAKVDTMISVGSAILGAVFGRGKISATTVSKAATAVRGAGRAVQQSGDVNRASESVEALQAQYAALETALQEEIDALAAGYDAQQEELERTPIKAKSGDVRVQLVALAWVPYAKNASGVVTAAWR